MKRIITLALFLIVGVMAASAQTPAATPGAQSPTEQTSNTLQQRPRKPERWRYDPAAKPGQDDNCAPQGLQKINPDDVNYGGLLATWRIAGVQETLENLYFWTIVLLLGGLILSLAYNTFLVKQRQERLIMAADVVCQITNAYLDARERVLGLTAQYNALVEEENAKTEKEEAAQQGGESPKKSSDASTKALQGLISASVTPQVAPTNTPTVAVEPVSKAPTDLFADDETEPVSPPADTTTAADDDDLNLTPQEKARNFKSRFPLTNRSGSQESAFDKHDSGTQNATATESPAPSTASEEEHISPTAAQPKSQFGPDLSQEMEKLRAKLARTTSQLQAREAQIGNQRKVNRELLDEVTTLREKDRMASAAAQEGSK